MKVKTGLRAGSMPIIGGITWLVLGGLYMRLMLLSDALFGGSGA